MLLQHTLELISYQRSRQIRHLSSCINLIFTMKYLSLIRPLVVVLSKLVFQGSLRNRYLELFDLYVTVIMRQQRLRGNLKMFSKAKACRVHILAILSGKPLYHSVHPSVAINKEGKPRLVSFLYPLLHGNVWDLRFLTS